MSIATEISRLQQAKASLKTSIEAKGVTVPSATTIDGYPALVNQIQTGFPDLEQTVELPNGYTQLLGLRKLSSAAFINTGIIADSDTNFEILFSCEPKTTSTASAICGIRRASGATDTNKFGLYCNANSYYSGFTIVHGSVDTRTISGSGSCVPFGGNIIKISYRNGKWYNWDRLIYDASSITIENQDNTPFFIGTLAKNQTTIYGNSSFLGVFFRVKFYSSNDELTHDFVPVMDDKGDLGMYDLAAENFVSVNDQNGWMAEMPANRAYRSTVLCNRLKTIDSSLSGFQSAVRYGGWTVGVLNHQRYFVLTNDKFEVKSSNTFSESGIVLECAEYESNWHGNGCWFGGSKYSEEDFFPLLYVNSCLQNHVIVVYRISGSSASDFAISIVQKIYTPIGDSNVQETLYCHDYFGFKDCNTFVETCFTNSDYLVAENDNHIVYREYALPSLSAGSEVFLSESDVIRRGTIPFIYAPSNGIWNGRYLMIANPFLVYVYEMKDNSFVPARIFSFGKNTENPDLMVTTSVAVEGEGVSWVDDEQCFLFLFEPINGLTYRVSAGDLEKYVKL